MNRPLDRYGRIARIYEALAKGWSLDAIRRAKVDALEDLPVRSSVLVVGGGAGEDLRIARAKSDRITVVDRSRAMLDRCSELAFGDASIDLVLGDARSIRGAWDCATLFFVLNVYDDRDAEQLLGSVAARVRPGGTIRIADFDPTLGLLQAGYHRIPRDAFRLLTRNAKSPIHDVESLARRTGLRVVRTHRIPVCRALPIGYRSWVLSRP